MTMQKFSLLAFAFGSSLVWAQVNTATISGTVRDESAPALGLGSYEVRAQLDGFQTQLRSGIVLTVGRAAVVDFTLQVGAVI